MELHRLHEIAGVFIPQPNVGAGLDRAWAVGKAEGSQSASFVVDVDLLEDNTEGCGIGIVPVDTTLQTLANLQAPGDKSNLAMYRLSLGSQVLDAFDTTSRTHGLNLERVRRVRLEFVAGETPRLSYGINDAEIVDVTGKLPKPLQPGNYKPCISLSSPFTKIRCRVAWRNPKRRLEGAAFVARVCQQSWKDRKFADIAVRTADGRHIPCHRAQLAAGSPVFAAELDRWAGKSHEIDVDGSVAAVEAMLEFFYTGELARGTDVAALLPLAHRYQVDDLVSLAVDRLLEGLLPESAVAAVRALRPLREEGEHLRDAWRELCRRMASDPALVEVLALSA
mmetsp:Transcript_115088/g.229200  ORF Transcript_115088/g.229200 Transcript_115088/m.229200 type:complete len:337 (+) Transcript_115088:76-1086(+)